MLYASTNKTQSNRDWTIVLSGADAPDVYVRASMLRYFHGLHTQTSGFFFNEGRLQRNTYNGDFGKQVRGDGEKKKSPSTV